MTIDAQQVESVGQEERVEPRSAYARVGGGPAVRELVDRFYKLVLADPELVAYFEVDMTRLKRHQAALLTKLLGGPDAYQGRELSQAHRHLGITRAHYHKVAQYLTYTMFAMQIPLDIIMAVGTIVASVEDQIVSSAMANQGGGH